MKKGFVPVCLATISGSIAIAYGAVEPILPYCNTACVSAGGSGAKDFHYVPPQSKGSYYNRFTVRGTAASRVSFRIVAKAVRMGGHWPDFRLQGLARPKESPSASLSFAAFDLCR